MLLPTLADPTAPPTMATRLLALRPDAVGAGDGLPGQGFAGQLAELLAQPGPVTASPPEDRPAPVPAAPTAAAPAPMPDGLSGPAAEPAAPRVASTKPVRSAPAAAPIPAPEAEDHADLRSAAESMAPVAASAATPAPVEPGQVPPPTQAPEPGVVQVEAEQAPVQPAPEVAAAPPDQVAPAVVGSAPPQAAAAADVPGIATPVPQAPLGGSAPVAGTPSRKVQGGRVEDAVPPKHGSLDDDPAGPAPPVFHGATASEASEPATAPQSQHRPDTAGFRVPAVQLPPSRALPAQDGGSDTAAESLPDPTGAPPTSKAVLPLGIAQPIPPAALDLAAPGTAARTADTPPPSHRPAAPHPATQIAPAVARPILVALAGPGGPGASQHLTIRLDPAELGRVQVRIERPGTGPAKVALVVERADTLLLLLRDQPQLHRALDLAGVPPDGRVVQFSLAPNDAGAAGPGGASDGPGSGASDGGRNPGQGSADPFGGGAQQEQPRRRSPAWRRAGLDITA